MNTPKPTTGEIRPNSAHALNPAVPVLLAAVEQDLMAVICHTADDPILRYLADIARHAVSLALGEIEADRAGRKPAGQGRAEEGQA